MDTLCVSTWVHAFNAYMPQRILVTGIVRHQCATRNGQEPSTVPTSKHTLQRLECVACTLDEADMFTRAPR